MDLENFGGRIIYLQFVADLKKNLDYVNINVVP